MEVHVCTQTRFSACLLMSSLAWAALSWQSSGQPPSDAPSAARAVQRYALANCEIEIGPPSEVGRAQGHFWFSTLHRVEGQDILCEVVLADDKAQGQWPAALHLSRDGGATWKPLAQIECYGPISMSLEARKLLIMPYETWPVSEQDKRNARADGTDVALDENGTIHVQRTPMKFLGFPRELADYPGGEVYLLTNGNILRLKNGPWFTTFYGKFAGDGKDSVWSATSADNGSTWQYQATVAEGATLNEAPEGANESNSVRLADGRLLCVYRTGSDYHKSYSADEGATWTAPERMNGVFCVEPQLARLKNGILLLSGGRPGLYVWACADGEGKIWERVNLAEHHNAHVAEESMQYSPDWCGGKWTDPPGSTSYTGMALVGDNEVLVCYDRLGNGWNGAPGPLGTHDAVFCVRIKAWPNQPK